MENAQKTQETKPSRSQGGQKGARRVLGAGRGWFTSWGTKLGSTSLRDSLQPTKNRWENKVEEPHRLPPCPGHSHSNRFPVFQQSQLARGKPAPCPTETHQQDR